MRGNEDIRGGANPMCSVCVYVHAYVWVFTSLLQNLIPAPLRCSFTAHSLHYTVIITTMLSLPSPLSSLLLSLLSVSLSSPPPFFYLYISRYLSFTLSPCFTVSTSPPLHLSLRLSSSVLSSPPPLPPPAAVRLKRPRRAKPTTTTTTMTTTMTTQGPICLSKVAASPSPSNSNICCTTP